MILVVVLVVVGTVVVGTGVVRPAAVVLVVVVGPGRATAMHPGYLYPLTQTKYLQKNF